MANELRDKGIQIANEAVQADHAQRYEEAIKGYVKAAEYLLTATKYEKNPVTLKTLREKCLEYTSRAEALKKGLDEKDSGNKANGKGKDGGKEDAVSDDDDEVEETPLTNEELVKAEEEMEAELKKLVGMASIKTDMRKLCKQLSLDIRRRQEGHEVLDSIRHMIFTGNPGVGKTTISRLVAKLYKELGVSSKDHVVEVQKGDLVAGYVNQTAMKTAKKIKEARGGILFVDEAYQLTQALMRGQSDFSGEAIDEMMKNMMTTGRKSVTFVFAGYKKEMDEFITYNAGLESRIKYRFHFDDYSVEDLVKIVNIKLTHKGYKLTADAARDIGAIISSGTDKELRSKYNGRLTDNLLQWASDEMNQRLPLDATGEQLITLDKADLQKAIGRFTTSRPPLKKDPALLGGERVEQQLKVWGLEQYAVLFVRAGYRGLTDLCGLDEQRVRQFGVEQDADVRRMLQLVERLRTEQAARLREMDALFVDHDMGDMRTWLDRRGLAEWAPLFEQHRVSFEVLGDLTLELLREMGLVHVGPRLLVHRAIAQWRDERNAKKEQAIRARLEAVQMQESMPLPGAPSPLGAPPPGSPDEMEQRIAMLKSLAQQQRHSMNFVPPFVNGQ